MPLSPKQLPKAITLSSLLDQLDREWCPETLDGGDEATLAVYYQASVRPALYWLKVDQYADPYRFEWPESAKQHRLYRLCQWLGGIEAGAAPAAREQMLAALRRAWPAYRDVAVPKDIADGTAALDYELRLVPYNWDDLVTHWGDPDPEARRTLHLPQFSNSASEDFHLTALALLYLNRQCRYALADLSPKGFES